MGRDQTGAQQAGDPGGGGVPDSPVVELRRQRLRPERAISVLTNRIAAALVHHEPGWQLPRLSVLARQYGATSEVLTAAVGELAARGLIRRTSSGAVLPG